ncbi:hypothetical protein D1AOALGA4SA_2817 [Olavius algarvensis Delta 1 endosymbiont]|nr:hypothetical protein D1AOALGA4SA_2817 [Olavius algarvensis Delta 1 endosymbiont]
MTKIAESLRSIFQIWMRRIWQPAGLPPYLHKLMMQMYIHPYKYNYDSILGRYCRISPRVDSRVFIVGWAAPTFDLQIQRHLVGTRLRHVCSVTSPLHVQPTLQ